MSLSTQAATEIDRRMARAIGITAILPAYNEEISIGSKVLRARQYADKVIVIDDGSNDRTAEVAMLAGAEVKRHLSNKGKSAALKTDFEVADSAGIIVTLDSDDQQDPEEIPKLVAPILNGEADVVNGSRFLNISKKLQGQITDPQSRYRAFSRKCFDLFKTNDFSLDAARKTGMRVKEVSIGKQVMVSVVIPAKNEEETIEACITKAKRALSEMGVSWEIIVADSSTDRTPEMATSLGATVVKPDRLGYGYAYLYGMNHASGKYIVIGDADDTYDFQEMPKLLEPLMRGEADFVLGSRFKGEIKQGAMPWLHRYIGNPLLTFFLNKFYKANTSDAHSGFRAFTREAMEKMKLKTHGMEFASEMIIKASSNGSRLREVPVTYHKRKGESKLSSFSDGWRHLKFMLLYTPKHLYHIPGFMLFILGILTMLFSYFRINIFYTPGIHSMIFGSLSAIVGYEIIILGLFAGVYGKRNGFFESDAITSKILKHATLERGILLGVAIFAAGFAYSLKLLLNWMGSGFTILPMSGQDMIGFTLLVVGLQTVFFSFFMSMIGGEKWTY